MTMLTRQLGQGKSPRAGHMWTERFWQETARKRTDAIAMFHCAEEQFLGLVLGPAVRHLTALRAEAQFGKFGVARVTK